MIVLYAGATNLQDKIRAALAQLDPTNNDHWTQAGLPNLKVVQELTGLSELSRDGLNQMSDGFVRPQPKTGDDAPDMTLDEVQAQLAALKAKADKLVREQDAAIIAATGKRDPQDEVRANQLFLAGQAKIREQKHAQRQAAIAALGGVQGLDPRSPLDQAFQRKTGFRAPPPTRRQPQ